MPVAIGRSWRSLAETQPRVRAGVASPAAEEGTASFARAERSETAWSGHPVVAGAPEVLAPRREDEAAGQSLTRRAVAVHVTRGPWQSEVKSTTTATPRV